MANLIPCCENGFRLLLKKGGNNLHIKRFLKFQGQYSFQLQYILYHYLNYTMSCYNS